MKTDFRKWSSLHLEDREYLPYKSGVYAVIDARSNELCYIGKSKNLHERWKGSRHHRYPQAKKLKSPVLLYLEVPEPKIHSLEDSLIATYETSWNNTRVPEQSQPFSWLNWAVAALIAAVFLAGYLNPQAKVTAPQNLNLVDYQGNQITTLPSGTELSIVGPVESDGWVPVRLPDGTKGYVFNGYLSSQ